MAKFRYNGTEERVFPTLGITVSPNQEFDAPDGFTAPDVSAATDVAKKPTKSAPSDMTEGE